MTETIPAIDAVGDALLQDLNRIIAALGHHAFPQLEVVTGDDDDTALRCPRCGGLVTGDDLRAVDVTEHWQPMLGIDADQPRPMAVFHAGDDEIGDSLYYLHLAGDANHAVTLPEGWVETWE